MRRVLRRQPFPPWTPVESREEKVNKFRKKPVVIEAMQWTGDNIQELWDWSTAEFVYGPTESNPLRLYVAANDAWLDLEVGEWIIKDVRGSYPCKPDIFKATYEPVP
jgi:hypothetical protein